uniref:Uncharacterized protein n=1 Tax=Fundulus heteroclitus TaxID=8078 RepID=A0A3Q2NXX5_FUNHE
ILTLEELKSLRKKYNVKLKNLQKSDSGIYTAKTVAPTEQKLSEYNVTVQDPVSQPYLYIDSVSSTSSSCNFTAICSTEDSSIRSSIRCDNKICHQDEGKRSVVTQSGASLHMFLSHSSIICNSSNQVSWSEKIVEIQQNVQISNLKVFYLFKRHHKCFRSKTLRDERMAHLEG